MKKFIIIFIILLTVSLYYNIVQLKHNNSLQHNVNIYKNAVNDWVEWHKTQNFSIYR